MVTKNRCAFHNDYGSAFYNKSGSESSPCFITYRQCSPWNSLHDILNDRGHTIHAQLTMGVILT